MTEAGAAAICHRMHTPKAPGQTAPTAACHNGTSPAHSRGDGENRRRRPRQMLLPWGREESEDGEGEHSEGSVAQAGGADAATSKRADLGGDTDPEPHLPDATAAAQVACGKAAPVSNGSKSSANKAVPTAKAISKQRQPVVHPACVMTDAARTLVEHSPYLVALRGLVDHHTLAAWAARYLAAEVCGIQARNTLEAKSRDLAGFVQWFVAFNGYGELKTWLPRDTQAYLNVLEGKGRAPTTVNRVFATLRRFARWAEQQRGNILGDNVLPTQGIKMLVVEEPDCKKLEPKDVHQLFKAADILVQIAQHPRQRPKRDRAILAMLYYTGMRVSELVQLKRTQYREGYLLNVARKGKARSKGVYVVAACRKLLEDYLASERLRDDPQGQAVPLFLAATTQAPMSRQGIGYVLQTLAHQASKRRKKPIYVHPHMLRHTFAALYRQKSGSDTETAAALGQIGLRYVGRYVRKSKKEREEVLEGMFTQI